MRHVPRLVSLLLALALLAAPATIPAQEVLTNDAVIAMKKAGLSDAVILAKIRSSQSKFDVSTQSLVTLKSAGLSDQIIEAMVGHGGPVAAPVAAPAAGAVAAPAGPLANARDTIFHASGSQYVELRAAPAEVEVNHAFFQNKSELVLKGRKANYRLGDKQPTFISTYPAAEVPLVRLKPGDSHDDRNLKIGSGFVTPFSGTQRLGVRNEDKIEVDSEKDPRGFYRIKPKQALDPGEYAFVVTHGLAAGGAGKAFDFGVD